MPYHRNGPLTDEERRAEARAKSEHEFQREKARQRRTLFPKPDHDNGNVWTREAERLSVYDDKVTRQYGPKRQAVRAAVRHAQRKKR